jgi:Flp pilus assembly protein TadG
MQLIRKFRRARRASITVEMALTVSMALVPILAGGADFFSLIAAKSQMNAALQSFYAYAWNNPGSATNTTQLGEILGQINQHSLPQITFPDGKTDGTTTYQPQLTYYCSIPPSTAQTAQSTPCPTTDTQQTIVTYNLTASVTLPVPLPMGLTSPYTISTSGQVEIQ